MNFTNLSNQFLENYPLRPSTQHSYSISFSLWSSYSKNKIPNPPLLLAYRQFRLARAKPGTVGKNFRALSSLLSWGEDEGVISLDFNHKRLIRKILKNLISPKKETIPDSYVRKLLKEAKLIDKRFVLIYKLVLATGCRIGEILNLEPKDVDLSNSILYIRPKSYWSPKSNSSIREVPLVSEELRKELEIYLSNLNDIYLFPKKPGVLWDRTFFTLQRRIFAQCELSGGSHHFRHFVATQLIRETGDVYLTSQILGHSRISTTERYLDSAPLTQKRDALSKIVDRPSSSI